MGLLSSIKVVIELNFEDVISTPMIEENFGYIMPMC